LQTLTVSFLPAGKKAEVEPGKTIMDAVLETGLPLAHEGLAAPCGGRGLCGNCMVRVISGKTGDVTAAEKLFLSPAQLEEGYRLACQATVYSDLKVEIPLQSMVGTQKLQIEGLKVDVVPETVIKRYSLPVTKTSIENPRSLWQQLSEALQKEYNLERVTVDNKLAGEVEPMAEEGSTNVFVRNSEIINVHVNCKVPLLGLAVDLGTTKIAGFLINLETGDVLATEGIMNPQIAYGEDVMARLSYALDEEENYNRIQKIEIDGLNHLVGSLSAKAGVSASDIAEAVIVGNTAMHHLLLHLPVSQLARAPYVPAVTVPVEVKARSLGLNLSKGAYVYLEPVIAGFVGGDHVAMILSSGIDTAEKVTLGLDIGTNTEIVLCYNGKMLSCSCASGPAFEGAHISQGMRAVNGAIYSVDISDDGLEVHWESIGDLPPIGICGSGILDAVAGLYRAGVLNTSGRMNGDHPLVRRAPGGMPEFVLVPAERAGIDRDIVITQKDISEIQLAKAAIAAGTKILLEVAGLELGSIEEVVVAGAFGTHLKLQSAVTIGMLPGLPFNLFRQVGNAAGTGACMALVSQTERRRSETIARRVNYIELMTQKSFQDVFINSLLFPEI